MVSITAEIRREFGKYVDKDFLQLDNETSQKLENTLTEIEKTLQEVNDHNSKLDSEMQLALDIQHGRQKLPTYSANFKEFLSETAKYMEVKNTSKTVDYVRTEMQLLTSFKSQFLLDKLPLAVEYLAVLFQQQQNKLRHIEENFEDQETFELVNDLYEVITADYHAFDQRIIELASQTPDYRYPAKGHPIQRLDLMTKAAYANKKALEEAELEARLAELGGIIDVTGHSDYK